VKHRKTRCQISSSIALFVCCAVSASLSHAEYFGSPTGRTAQFASQPQMTIEATLSTGDFNTADYQQLGLRLNYQYTPNILVFGDLGQSKLNSESDTSIGFGAYYSLNQSILGSDHSAMKVSYHQVNFAKVAGVSSSTAGNTSIEYNCRPDNPITLGGILDDDLSPQVNLCLPEVNNTGGTRRTSAGSGGDIRNIAIELLISGDMSDSFLAVTDANWYANGGIQMLDGDLADDTVLGIGAGIVIPLNESEVYAGVDYADETQLGIGFRYFIK